MTDAEKIKKLRSGRKRIDEVNDNIRMKIENLEKDLHAYEAMIMLFDDMIDGLKGTTKDSSIKQILEEEQKGKEIDK